MHYIFTFKMSAKKTFGKLEAKASLPMSHSNVNSTMKSTTAINYIAIKSALQSENTHYFLFFKCEQRVAMLENYPLVKLLISERAAIPPRH